MPFKRDRSKFKELAENFVTQAAGSVAISSSWWVRIENGGEPSNQSLTQPPGHTPPHSDQRLKERPADRCPPRGYPNPFHHGLLGSFPLAVALGLCTGSGSEVGYQIPRTGTLDIWPQTGRSIRKPDCAFPAEWRPAPPARCMAKSVKGSKSQLRPATHTANMVVIVLVVEVHVAGVEVHEPCVGRVGRVGRRRPVPTLVLAEHGSAFFALRAVVAIT